MRGILLGLMILASGLVMGCGHLAGLIREGVETEGSAATGVPVQVEYVHLNLLLGLGEIRGITVANPDGYRAVYAFSMDALRLDLAMRSLLGMDPLVLDELLIDSPVVTFEPHPEGGSNLQEIADASQADPVPDEVKPEEPNPDPPEPPGEPLRISVRKLVIKGVSFRLGRLDGTWAEGTLPAIELLDVGGSDGDTAAGLGSTVVLTMARQVFFQVAARELGSFEELPDVLDPEYIVAQWEESLGLAPEQMEEVRAYIAEQTVLIQHAVDEARAQGLLDLGVLSEGVGAAAEAAQEQLADVLTPGQLAECERLLDELERLTAERVWDLLVDEWGVCLKLSPDQLAHVRPLLRAQISARMELLGRFARDRELPWEVFLAEYEGLREETLATLGEMLGPEQMINLLERLQRVEDQVQAAYRGTMGP